MSTINATNIKPNSYLKHLKHLKQSYKVSHAVIHPITIKDGRACFPYDICRGVMQPNVICTGWRFLPDITATDVDKFREELQAELDSTVIARLNTAASKYAGKLLAADEEAAIKYGSEEGILLAKLGY